MSAVTAPEVETAADADRLAGELLTQTPWLAQYASPVISRGTKGDRVVVLSLIVRAPADQVVVWSLMPGEAVIV